MSYSANPNTFQFSDALKNLQNKHKKRNIHKVIIIIIGGYLTTTLVTT